jgi:GNAT superfamily N-acetyltransferase
MSTPAAASAIHCRLMVASDLGRVPIGHQGDAEQVARRIAELGSSAVLAFDGDAHVGQLQFRLHVPGTRSPAGLHDPLYWGDFGEHEPPLPTGALGLFCYHVGQLDDTDARDARYQGRGIGAQLLDTLLAWADERGVPALVAKAVPPHRPVMAFMGGQPPAVYEERGFTTVASWVDADLRAVVARDGLAPAGVSLDDASRVSCCIRRPPGAA